MNYFKILGYQILLFLITTRSSAQISTIDVLSIAKNHNIISDVPGPDFFEGDVLGNGGLGLCITSRPDALMLHLGHNNVWDQRLSEIPLDSIGTFKDVYNLILGSKKRLEAQGLKNPHPLDITKDTFLNNYIKKLSAIGDKPWPRPFPCGTLYFGFDPLNMFMVKRELNISNGVWTVTYNKNGDLIYIDVFVARGSDKILVKAYDAKGNSISLPFNRFRILPHDDSGSKMPSPQTYYDEKNGVAKWSQHLPKHAPLVKELTPNKIEKGDQAFSVTLKFDKPFKQKIYEDRNYAVPIIWWQDEEPYIFTNDAPQYAELSLAYGAADSILKPIQPVQTINWPDYSNSQYLKTTTFYKEYWNKSSIQLQDKELEKVWYRNTYFSSCVLAPGYQCPGLYGNFIYKDIGTAWHGDYHFDYNVQQLFWGTFSSNRLELHLPYIEMVKKQIPLAHSWAQTFYQLPGTYFGVTGYPFVGKTLPHYNPVYSNYMSTTPWAVQSLWWHYLYTQDTAFLRNTLYPILKDAAIFMNAYITRKDAINPALFGDTKYHVYPTVAAELYNITLDFKYNIDGIGDLSLTRFLFDAVIKSADLLKIDQALKSQLTKTLKNLANYPTRMDGDKMVWADVMNGKKLIYNVPWNMMPVFPSEQVTLNSSAQDLKIANDSYNTTITEGGNDLVYNPMIEARLGRLDLEKFKRNIKYNMMPNGTCTDKLSVSGGRYSDYKTDFNLMTRMGIWIENFALTAPINEGLMQSVGGVIRLFPSWDATDAKFNNLRAVGGFLVNAEKAKGEIKNVLIKSEKGGALKIINPWPGRPFQIKVNNKIINNKFLENIEIQTMAGDVVELINPL